MSVHRRATWTGKAVAVLAVLGAVAAGCSSVGDSAEPSGGASDEPAAASAHTDAAPAETTASPEDQAEIIAITKTYVTGLNNGDAKMLEYAMCQAMLDQFGDLSVGARPSPTPQQVDGITDISVMGDLGFGTVEYTMVDDPSAPAASIPLAYKNESGWKVCSEV